MTAVNQRFYWQYPFADTIDDTDVVAALYNHVLQWVIDNPTYALQTTTIQYDIVRAPVQGGPYGEIIWYAELK